MFETVETHFAANSLEELESVDVSSLANAFSRVALTHKVCWAKISERLREDASSALLPPAAATMAMNAFAVVKQCDAELFMALVDSSVRRGCRKTGKPHRLFCALNCAPVSSLNLLHLVNSHVLTFLCRRPCMGDFTLTQAALLLDAAARCSHATLI